MMMPPVSRASGRSIESRSVTAGKPRIVDSSAMVPGVGQHARGVQLELVVVVEAERLVEGRCPPGTSSPAAPRAACGCAGGWRRASAVPNVVRTAVEAVQQRLEPIGRVDVLLAVGADEEVAARASSPAGPARPRPRSAVAVGVEDLAHRRPGEEDAARVQTLGEQVAPGVLGVDEVEVGHVVDEAPVGLLGHVLVEAAVAGLHVVDGDPHALRHDGGDAAVGVAEHEDGVGRSSRAAPPRSAISVSPRTCPRRRGVHAEQVVRLADARGPRRRPR